MSRRFVKIAVEVAEAMKLEYNLVSIAEIIEWIRANGGECSRGRNGGIIISTLEGNMVANTGAYIIKGAQGEFYPCKSDIFEQTYKEIK